jgi:hypothetical protein
MALLEKYKIPVPKGKLAKTVDEAYRIAQETLLFGKFRFQVYCRS